MNGKIKKTNDYNKSLSIAKQLQKLYNEGYDFVEKGYFQKLRVSENGEKVYEFLIKTITNFMKIHEKYQTALIIIEELASPNSNVSNLEYIFIKSQMEKDFVDCIIVELQNKTAFVKSANKEKEIELLKGLIKANKRIIELTDNRKEKEDLKIENEDLRTILKNKTTASQKYTDEDFEQYKKCYFENGFNWKVAFAKLQKITLNEHIKNATSYNSFDTAFKKKYPENKKT